MERDLVLHHLESAEPLPRSTCTHELDASRPIGGIVDALVRIARGTASRTFANSANFVRAGA